MSKLLVAALSFAFLVSVGGCKHHDDDMDDMDHHDNMSMSEKSGTSEKKMSTASPGADQCSHCPGVQTLDESGKCPQCKQKMK
jgi:hypothetical protein